MGCKHKAVYAVFGILLAIILTMVVADMIIGIRGHAGASNNPQNLDGQREQNMSEALEQQKKILTGIANNGSYIPANFRYYDIVYFKKFSSDRYEVEILGEYEDVNVVRAERYKFNIRTSELKNNENMGIIMDMTKDALNGILIKQSNLPDILDDYSIVYYKDFGEGEYEFGIDAEGKQYYFLLEDHRPFSPRGRWVVHGWSEGILPNYWSVPNNWNDVIAMQYYDSTDHSKLSIQEYEKFFPAYADNIYKLMAESSKLYSDMKKYNDKAFGGKHYGLIAENELALYWEAQKVMKIEAPDKYKTTHAMLVKAMYGASRLASVYVKGNEGYKDEEEYNKRSNGPLMINPREIVNMSYACFEAEKQNKAFAEKAYYDVELKNDFAVSKVINKYYEDHWNPEVMLSYWGRVRINNTQYEAYVDEYRSNENSRKSFRFTLEKDKYGKWIIINRTEM